MQHRVSSKITRRQFLLKLAGVIGTGAALSGCKHNPLTPTTSQIQLEKIDISHRKIPAAFHGYRIGLLSDIHFGHAIPDEWVEQALQILEQERIQLLLLGGDYIWIAETALQRAVMVYRNKAFSRASNSELARRIYERLSDIINTLTPPDGIYAVAGNHDNWVAPQQMEKHFSRKNIHLLKNTSLSLYRAGESISLSGIDDFWTGIPEFPALSPDDSFKIGLTHNPDLYGVALAHRIPLPDLCLAGHTHGGQIRLPVLGALSYHIQDLRFAKGLKILQNRHFYTTKGLGVVEIPHRINCPAEVTVFTLQARA